MYYDSVKPLLVQTNLNIDHYYEQQWTRTSVDEVGIGEARMIDVMNDATKQRRQCLEL